MSEKFLHYYDKELFARIPGKKIGIGTLMTKRMMALRNVQFFNAGRYESGRPLNIVNFFLRFLLSQ